MKSLTEQFHDRRMEVESAARLVANGDVSHLALLRRALDKLDALRADVREGRA